MSEAEPNPPLSSAGSEAPSRDGALEPFVLDGRLEADTHPVVALGLCELRLMDDSRWPWLILVPRRRDVREVHALRPLDQVLLTHEQVLVSGALQAVTGCRSVNVAALGNVVAQLHVHVVARDRGDPNWPAPVWGHGERIGYRSAERDALIERVREAL